MYLVTVADFKQYMARGRHSLDVEKTGKRWKKTIFVRKLVSRILGELVFDYRLLQYITSRERRKSALNLRLKIVKGDPLGFVKLQLVAKYEKNWKGDPLEILKNFLIKIFLMRFLEQCHSAGKFKRRAIWDFLTSLFCKISTQTKKKVA